MQNVFLKNCSRVPQKKKEKKGGNRFNGSHQNFFTILDKLSLMILTYFAHYSTVYSIKTCFGNSGQDMSVWISPELFQRFSKNFEPYGRSHTRAETSTMFRNVQTYRTLSRKPKIFMIKLDAIFHIFFFFTQRSNIFKISYKVWDLIPGPRLDKHVI